MAKISEMQDEGYLIGSPSKSDDYVSDDHHENLSDTYN